MSTTSLPSYYVAPNLPRTPSYTEEPQEHEQRIGLADRLQPRSSGTFVKQSKGGDARLTLNGQNSNATLPAYGSGGTVDGTIDVFKTEGVKGIDVKIEGRLQIKEIAEGGTVDRKLCLASVTLWSKNRAENSTCPNSCPFQLSLPNTVEMEGKSYQLPPTYSVKLSGLPGFTAFIEYSVSVTVHKSAATPVKASFLGLSIGTITLSTPFAYYPRTRPAMPSPPPLRLGRQGFECTQRWTCYNSTIPSRSSSLQHIQTHLYLPSSRIFCASQSIPFHLTFQSSATSLAAFLPLGPSASSKKPTRVQLMRQVTVDVRNDFILGTKTDIWRVDCLGEAVFKYAGDGPQCISFSGEIAVDPSIKVMGFNAGGLTVKDCILFSMTPPEGQKAPFSELRQAIPIRLTTDMYHLGGRWAADGSGIESNPRSDLEYSIPSSPDSLSTSE